MKKLILQNIGLKISAVLIAVFLWFFVASRGQSEITIEAPLEFRDIPVTLGIVSASAKTAMLTIRGQERFMKGLRTSDIRISIDMAKAKSGEDLFYINKEDIKLPIAMSVTSVVPTSVKVRLEEMATRQVPVRVRLIGLPGEGTVRSISVDPKTVVIKGLKSEISKVKSIRTEEFDLSSVTQDVTQELSLDSSGINVVPEVSRVNVKIRIAGGSR